MRISIDTRDIYDYLDVEAYIKERDYIINPKECELLKEKCESIGVLETTLELDQIKFLFQTQKKENFYCWSNIKKGSEEPRERIITYNHEDLTNKELINFYLEERNRLINQKEFNILSKLVMTMNPNVVKYETGNFIGNVKNQTAGIWRCYFGNYELWTNIMYFKFDKNVLERRRN